jgi:chemotaxis response regulator CheB
MKVLIVDDSVYKVKDLTKFFNASDPTAEIRVAKSFHSALNAIAGDCFDLVLLDMTLPTSEQSDGEIEGRDRIFGGRELLAEMEFEEVTTKAIIITQFDNFGDGQRSITLDRLMKQLRDRHGNTVIGGVYYSNLDTSWTTNLAQLLRANGFIR